MKGRLFTILVFVVLLLALALPALPSISPDGSVTGAPAGVVHASDPTPTPTPGTNANCHDITQCG